MQTKIAVINYRQRLLLQAVADKATKLSEFARTMQTQNIINLITITAIDCSSCYNSFLLWDIVENQ